jgi:hypothetical protein
VTPDLFVSATPNRLSTHRTKSLFLNTRAGNELLPPGGTHLNNPCQTRCEHLPSVVTALKDRTLTGTRRLLLAVLCLGCTGTAIELLLLDHYEDAWQLAPLCLLTAGVAILAWHARRPGRTSRVVLQSMMILFIVFGVIGVGLHFKANVEFQTELDPGQSRSQMLWKVMRAKAPPALAPGIMVQLGLLGLIYGYRDQ